MRTNTPAPDPQPLDGLGPGEGRGDREERADRELRYRGPQREPVRVGPHDAPWLTQTRPRGLVEGPFSGP